MEPNFSSHSIRPTASVRPLRPIRPGPPPAHIPQRFGATVAADTGPAPRPIRPHLVHQLLTQARNSPYPGIRHGRTQTSHALPLRPLMFPVLSRCEFNPHSDASREVQIAAYTRVSLGLLETGAGLLSAPPERRQRAMLSAFAFLTRSSMQEAETQCHRISTTLSKTELFDWQIAALVVDAVKQCHDRLLSREMTMTQLASYIIDSAGIQIAGVRGNLSIETVNRLAQQQLPRSIWPAIIATRFISDVSTVPDPEQTAHSHTQGASASATASTAARDGETADIGTRTRRPFHRDLLAESLIGVGIDVGPWGQAPCFRPVQTTPQSTPRPPQR